jgi:hypothetical protein
MIEKDGTLLLRGYPVGLGGVEGEMLLGLNPSPEVRARFFANASNKSSKNKNVGSPSVRLSAISRGLSKQLTDNEDSAQILKERSERVPRYNEPALVGSDSNDVVPSAVVIHQTDFDDRVLGSALSSGPVPGATSALPHPGQSPHGSGGSAGGLEASADAVTTPVARPRPSTAKSSSRASPPSKSPAGNGESPLGHHAWGESNPVNSDLKAAPAPATPSQQPRDAPPDEDALRRDSGSSGGSAKRLNAPAGPRPAAASPIKATGISPPGSVVENELSPKAARSADGAAVARVEIPDAGGGGRESPNGRPMTAGERPTTAAHFPVIKVMKLPQRPSSAHPRSHEHDAGHSDAIAIEEKKKAHEAEFNNLQSVLENEKDSADAALKARLAQRKAAFY